MFYSVPHELIGKEVEIKVTSKILEIYFNHMRVASHTTLYGKFGQFSTIKVHMPDNHRLYVEQTPAEAIKWASIIGSSTLKAEARDPKAIDEKYGFTRGASYYRGEK